MFRRPGLPRACLTLLLLGPSCSGSRQSPHLSPTPAPSPSLLGLDGRPDTRPDAGFASVVRKECGACHLPPAPADLPRGLWRERIGEMARFSLSRVGLARGDESGLSGLDTAPFVTYFESRAPETLETPASWPEAVSGSVRFRRRMLSPKGALPVPIVASARLLDVDGDGRLKIVACDMGHGVVLLGSPARDGSELREIAKVPSPVHAAVADLDRDGQSDLLVADVGAFLPGDHEKGAVVWLRADGKGGFEKRVLADRLPRVTDVEAADFDGDGDLDLAVAASGYHVGGGLLLYENRTTDWREPHFVPTVLDERSGVVQATPADLDGDGRTDLVALIARQHQAVVAFLNRGAPAFEKRTLFTAPTPAWGSTGLELVDLDGDSDLDLLLTNGDTLEDASVKPYHGVRWLENRGSDSWARHDLAALPGAQRAIAKDLDGDSDLDVVVAAFLPDPERVHGALTSLGWLEQTRPRVFEPHALQKGQLSHAALDLGDVDGDGDVDLVVGNFVGFTFARTGTGFGAEGWLELWENLRLP
jgi:hypothetical protein